MLHKDRALSSTSLHWTDTPVLTAAVLFLPVSQGANGQWDILLLCSADVRHGAGRS